MRRRPRAAHHAGDGRGRGDRRVVARAHETLKRSKGRLPVVVGFQEAHSVCATSSLGASLEHEALKCSKWQNGFLARDGCIYGIPLKVLVECNGM